MSSKSTKSLGRRHWLIGGRRWLLPLIVILFLLLMVLGSYGLLERRAVTNYTNPDGPKYEGSHNAKQPFFDGQLKVVTWNIAFAEKVDQAIVELKRTEALQQADILLLQEMDETGTQHIAQALGYNYVYYPASIHSRHGRNFGNAVLSRWPIVDSAKVILPHENPSNGQIRIAARATINVDGRHIPAYSVHTETFWLGPEQRKDQIATLAQDAALVLAQGSEYALIGGDFNTLTANSLVALTSSLEEAGLEWVSQGAGETVDRAGVGVSLDHLFASSMTPLSTGVVTDTKASDHYPVWVNLALE
jgi:endonuclease/exonuclease/phosphatase family metal-dependent hydrolase